MKDTFYLAGPMQGRPNWNFAAFQDAATKLRGKGYTIVSPAEINADAMFLPSDQARLADRPKHLKKDIRALLRCTGIIMLPGWETSKGALLEKHIADELEYPVLLYDPETGEVL